MDPGVAGFIGVVVGSITTDLVTVGAQYLRGKQEIDLDSVKRRDDRRLALNQFEIEALLGIQDQVLALRETSAYLSRHPEAAPLEQGDAH